MKGIYQFVLVLFILVYPLGVNAADGDILFHCDFDTYSGDELDRWQSAADAYGIGHSSTSYSDRELSTAGVDGSNCARSDATDGHAYTPISLYLDDNYPDEVTFNFWEKINVTKGDGDLPVAGANIKALRVYNNHDSSTYELGSVLSHHFDKFFYTGVGGVSIVEFGDIVYDRKNYGSYYAYDNGDGTYTAIGDGEDDRSNVSVKMSPWAENNVWYNLRIYIKYPTSDQTYDGEYTIWFNDRLVFRATDVKIREGQDTTVKGVRFLPDARGDEGFYQYLDEVTMYEGYVPPGDEPEPPEDLPIPQGMSIIISRASNG